MSGFAGEDLFGSGRFRVVDEGIEQRVSEQEQPGVDGATVTALGRSARRLTQTGALMADDVTSLVEQIGRIEAVMDGRRGELRDEAGRRWADVMLTGFEPGPTRRKGARLAVDYRARWMQVNG